MEDELAARRFVQGITSPLDAIELRRHARRNKIVRRSREALRSINKALEVIREHGDDSTDQRNTHRLGGVRIVLEQLLADEAKADRKGGRRG